VQASLLGGKASLLGGSAFPQVRIVALIVVLEFAEDVGLSFGSYNSFLLIFNPQSSSGHGHLDIKIVQSKSTIA